MSLASSPDFLFRAEDKALKMLFPTTEQPHSNTFDEFFHQELYESSDDDPIKREDSAESPEMFAVMPTNPYDPVPADDDHPESLPQPWRKGLWCMSGQPNSQLVVGKTRKATGTPPSIISPAHLVVNDNFAMRSPKSTTQPYQTKNSSPTRFRHQQYQTLRDEQRIRHELARSPSPMYSRSFVDDRNGYVDAWQQDFQDFNLQLDDDYTESIANNLKRVTPNPNRSPEHLRRAHMADRPVKTDHRSATMHHFGGHDSRHNLHQATHELSSILNANLNATGRNTFSAPAGSNNMNFRFVNEEIPTLPSWTTESLHSSNSSHNSQHSQHSQDSQQMAGYNTLPPQSWWSPSPAIPQCQHTQASVANYPILAQPKPRRVTHHAFGHEIDHEGLGINYPSSEEIGIAVPYHPPELQSPTMTPYHVKHSNVLASYPPLPPPVGHDFIDESPFTTPRRTGYAPSRTPSPVSPTQRPSRSLRQRSPSRREPSQHRRKSIQKAGPIKGAETPRHRSTSRPPRTPKTPKTPHDGQGPMGFVNFTPKDASKLLNDVAPSGSSKTRARREQEAREKRKKLSEAALNAVRSAGGDVEALERAILA